MNMLDERFDAQAMPKSHISASRLRAELRREMMRRFKEVTCLSIGVFEALSIARGPWTLPSDSAMKKETNALKSALAAHQQLINLRIPKVRRSTSEGAA